jgi:ubiquinone/menaquinone biosynthesis C-methylase UbiE
MEFAAREYAAGGRRLLDLGCGAARNAAPLAREGWEVLGTDTSWPMLKAAAARMRAEAPDGRLHLAAATMDRLPVADGSADLIVAHGIWNLAGSGEEFRQGIREAARTARPGAALFVFTFSRHTLPPAVRPVSGETFVFTEFAGEPQCFLTEAQLVEELAAVGFVPDAGLPLKELNRPAGLVRTSGPVIYEGGFRLTR